MVESYVLSENTVSKESKERQDGVPSLEDDGNDNGLILDMEAYPEDAVSGTWEGEGDDDDEPDDTPVAEIETDKEPVMETPGVLTAYTTTTRSGRKVRTPERFADTALSNLANVIEQDYRIEMANLPPELEFCFVGPGMTSGTTNTPELELMTSADEVMSNPSEILKWEK